MTNSVAIQVEQLSHRYGDRLALSELSLEVSQGNVFAFLGPNGGGKTTLFRLLSTLLPIQQGEARVFGHDIRRQMRQVREAIGVVFQAPSLDKKLTVRENIRHQAVLYGLSGKQLNAREKEMLELLGLTDRTHEPVESLSGGLRRRVELAKGMIHQPRLLLLDEPTTGLDPGARSDVWRFLMQLRDQAVTIVFTTHLLEEADRADKIAILDEGTLVALDSPDALRQTVGGDAITITTPAAESLVKGIGDRLGLTGKVVDGQVRLELPDGHNWIPRIVQAFPESISSIQLGKPTLEDVFISKTGHRFWQAKEEESGE